MIKIRNLAFEYFDRDDEGHLTEMINAIRGINFSAKKGDFIAVTGKNGSGKSTFARILNRLLVPIEGTVVITGLDAMDEENTMEIRKKVGMVFQNPDDQLIGSIVAEDVAFGAENIGVAENKLWNRVIGSLETVGFDDAKNYSEKRINQLSGGERQKVALAGVLAMQPDCIVLDEATSMLDQKSRNEILSLLRVLNQKVGITIIMITHLMDELVYADQVYVMHQGTVAMKGRCQEIYYREEQLKSLGLEVPVQARLAKLLFLKGIVDRDDLFTAAAVADNIKHKYPNRFYLDTAMPKERISHRKQNPMRAIIVNDMGFSYGGTQVLEHVSFSIEKGEYVAIVGRTGAGKSTLLQQLPGLLKPTQGNVFVDGIDIWDKTTDLRSIRCKIGFIFQYPEQQLFAKNVYEDVVFGPRNVGVSEVEAEKRAYESIRLVGLPEDVYDMPMDKLSGGQKRRVALAGVLAMQPDYLILDEPVAGLDPEGKREILQIIDALHKEAGITIIVVSHDVESVSQYAERVLIVENKTATDGGTPAEAFYHLYRKDGDINMLPYAMQLLVNLRQLGMDVDCFETDVNRCVKAIEKALGR
ncbi:MAG: energy-coupling factor transporter ATPase [Clostridium sp.]|nr:energy-coupling factor transporter ATPase [Clostridium sp.]MCM1398563.1 energy-coupling factor transporter ATPase [Clostridium sp.]MCM1459851.1 energy-coupling factor transporter ATPase [Bacteroides sp.]